MNRSIAVFTAWPDQIKDQHKCFDIVFETDTESLVSQCVGTHSHKSFERYVAQTHDRGYHKPHQLCLFVNAPVQIDLSDLIPFLDQDYTTLKDVDLDWILYQRKPVWQENQVVIEKSPYPVGIIFIDCWEKIMQHSAWIDKPHHWNFYVDMKNQLTKYQIKSMIFHTGNYGGLPLAIELQSWAKLPNSQNIMDLQVFQDYYKKVAVQDWIVVGAHWQRCTHDKPLGFHNLLKLKKQDPELRIYSHKVCTVKFVNNDIEHPVVSTLDSQDYAQDTLHWKLNGNLYELLIE